MTLQIVFMLGVLVVMIYLFLTELIPVEITAFLTLIVLLMAGLLQVDEVFAGFSSPAVITILLGFFVSAALHHTGVADAIGGRIRAVAGSREALLVALVMMVTALLSAVMPNVAAAAVMMPTVTVLSRQTGVPASRLFMPLAFGALLGGTLTMIGTPPNLVAADALAEHGLEPFTLFSFTYFGAALSIAGVLLVATFGRRWLPERSPAAPPTGTELASMYRISERLFSLRVPGGSALDGVTLQEARLGTALGVNVMAIRRGDHRITAPPPDTVVRDGDLLIVEGEEADLRELLRLRGLEIADAGQSLRLADSGGLFTGVVLRVGEGSALIGRTVQRLRFRERYGGLVVALWRDGERLYDRPGGLPLEEGDELLALGDRSEVEQMAAHPDFDLVEIGPPTMRRLEESVFQLRVTPGSALADLTVRECRMGELTGLTIVGRIPLGGRLEAVTPDVRLAEGDLLLVSGEPTRVANLLRFGEIEVDERVEAPEIESGGVKVVEAIVAPRSSVDGRTLRELDFRERYGLQVLALMRGGEPIHEGLADLRLRVGDALLLQGPVAKISHLGSGPDFLVLTPGYEEVFRTRKAPVTLAALAVMIGVVVAGIYPIQIAVFIAAVIVVALGALTMEQAYRAIDWRTVLLVAAVLPLGTAIERSGTALWLAGGVAGLAGELGPYALLIALMVLSSLLSQVITGGPAVAILAPVAFVAAERAGIDVRPLLMGIALAASATFMTPFSHKANLLVMGAGGYKAADYLRVGTVLTLVTLAIITLMVPLLLPF